VVRSTIRSFNLTIHARWKPFDPSRNWPDLGHQFITGERAARAVHNTTGTTPVTDGGDDKVEHDKRDLDWSAVLKRTFESYIRGERPNIYGEWIHW
jgi:WD repeat and SOF domain-containing protein 1